MGLYALSAGDRPFDRAGEHARRSLRPPTGLSRVPRALRSWAASSRSPRQTIRSSSSPARSRRSARAESFPSRPRRSATSFPRGGAAQRWAWSPQRGELAAVVGPSIGGLITHFISWRWIFAANVPLAAVVFALALRDVPSDCAAPPRTARRRRPRTALHRAARVDGRIDRDATAHRCDRRVHPGLLRGLGDRCSVTRSCRSGCSRRDSSQDVRARNPHRHPGRLALLHSDRTGRCAGSFVCRRRFRSGARRLHLRRRDSVLRTRARSDRQPRRSARRRDPRRTRAWRSSRSASNRLRSRCSR